MKREPVKHGTLSGYAAERRRGLPHCRPCTEANTRYAAEWSSRRRTAYSAELIETRAERDRSRNLAAHLEAQLATIRAEWDRWDSALDQGCPGCGAFMSTGSWTCDHVEGYHYAYSDMRRALGIEDES